MDEEEFVFGVVEVPVEGALELDELDLLAVEVGGDAGRPVVGKGGKGVAKIDLHDGG